MAFNFGTAHLPKQVQHIINAREEEAKRTQEKYKTTVKSSVTYYHTSIFMRLGNDLSSNLNGIQTMKIYEDFIKNGKTVWFSTNSLDKGMAKEKLAEFLKAINQGDIVEIYFVLGKASEGDNEIRFKAEVIDIKSDRQGMPSPDKNLTPENWKDVNKKIWIKIKNLKPFSSLTTRDFIVRSTGNVLADSIIDSEYHFGYIKKA